MRDRELVQLNTLVEPSDLAALKAIAQQRDRSASSTIRELIRREARACGVLTEARNP
jgi:hypothetical protein